MIVKFAYNNYCSERAGVAEWQTHLTQNQAGNTVWVQVPPPAPNKSSPGNGAAFIFGYLGECGRSIGRLCWL